MARERLGVGLDIGSSSVKLCMLKRSRQDLNLLKYAKVALPHDAITDGTINDPAAVQSAIAELLRTHKVRRRQAAISISGHSVIIKKIALPQQSRAELEQSIQWEAEQFIPFELNDVYLDVQILNEESAQAGHMDVILVAAKKDYVQEYTSVVEKAGLDPVICDVDAFAIENMLKENYELPPGQSIGLVNIGASKTNINVVVDGTTSFTRDLTIGGNTFTEEIQKRLHLSFDDAEDVKHSRSVKANDKNTADVNKAVETGADQVSSEIQRSLDFHSATSADPAPSHIYLTGGTSRIDTLREQVQSRLGVGVSVVDPFRHIGIEGHDAQYLQAESPMAGVALGLALRYSGDS